MSAGVTAVQTGTMAFVNGELESAERVPLAAAFAATKQALDRLNIPVEKSTIYPHIAFVTGMLGDGRRIKVTLERESAVFTKFSLRVGAWGDQPVSRVIMVQIQEELTPEWGPPVEPVK
jgi:hypothetical protein